MKSLMLRCVDCEAVSRFEGEDIDSVLRQIDESGWHDFPEGKEIKAWCPACDAIEEGGGNE